MSVFLAKSRSLNLLETVYFIFFGSTIQRLIGVILLPIYTRFLTPIEYGTIGLLILIQALAVSIFSLGLSVSIGVCYFNESAEEKRGMIILAANIITLLTACILIF